MLGITFKENCPDIRNSKAIDVYRELKNYGMEIDIYDPWASNEEVENEFSVGLIEFPEDLYDAVVHVVAHKQFKNLDLALIRKPISIIYDVKGTLDKDIITNRL